MKKILYTTALALLFFIPSINAKAIEVLPGSAEEIPIKEFREDLKNSINTGSVIGRTCLNGRENNLASGEPIEVWIDFECTYCSKEKILRVGNSVKNCLIVRHSPTSNSSLEKSLIFEALLLQSAEAAQEFWSMITPQGDGSVISAKKSRSYLEKIITKHQFNAGNIMVDISTKAAEIVKNDKFIAQTKITSTPTYIVKGVRFASSPLDIADINTILSSIDEAKKSNPTAIEKLEKLIQDI